VAKVYKALRAELVRVIDETPNIKTLVLRPERPFPFATGQFAELMIPGVGEAPFTPSSSPSKPEEIEMTIMKAGRLTAKIHELSPGALLGLRGPYGKGYPLEKFQGKTVLIVGGGVGLAPLRSLLFALFEELDKYERVILAYGARTPKDLVYKDGLKEWAQKIEVHLTVDVGDESWSGKVGVVTTLLPEIQVDVERSVAVVCGPPIMMKFTTRDLLAKGFKPEQIYLSMEKNMSCGIGKCGHCRLGPFYVCRDGPVFSYDQLEKIANIWD